ncbi:MAG TPA: 2-phospho-L-lactate transferase [Steroidobacteraceae bacterium]|nr:2-phospho-L-lactate transferase [Steroidobacteraceae bacterium]
MTREVVLAISGGVGGAKLAVGLQGILDPGALGVIVNTGDDFEHLGLAISPDVDTTLYTLAGVANPATGWGRAQESWVFMQELARLGGESWFQLGDKDLALHIERTRRLTAGETLSHITAEVAHRLGVSSHILPMSDASVRTMLMTDEGELAFQDYFVRRRCEPRVREIHFAGAAAAQATPAALAWLDRADLTAIVICPSNPYLSIDPILAIAEWRRALELARVPVIAVSPVIGGEAVKGPTAKIMRELNLTVTNATIARHYASLIDGLLIDSADAVEAGAIGVPVHETSILMRTGEDKERVAAETLAFARSLA